MDHFRYFRRYSSIFLEFIPQFIFLVFLFFWMVIMMFMKWIMYGPVAGTSRNTFTQRKIIARFILEPKFRPGCAPSVLIYFINMMLFKQTQPPEGCDEFMFEFQPTLQKILVFVSLICIPVMLLGKPLYIMSGRRKHKPKVNE